MGADFTTLQSGPSRAPGTRRARERLGPRILEPFPARRLGTSLERRPGSSRTDVVTGASVQLLSLWPQFGQLRFPLYSVSQTQGALSACLLFQTTCSFAACELQIQVSHKQTVPVTSSSCSATPMLQMRKRRPVGALTCPQSPGMGVAERVSRFEPLDAEGYGVSLRV